ncbi:MAG: DNA replication protein [Hyphomicrobium sp.]|nr:DNA replication protein [Hyphomicrobium sp.]
MTAAEHARATADAPSVNLDESPLAWLARRKDKDGNPMLSDAEVRAGERLRADFWFGQMTPRVTANWSGLVRDGGGGRLSAPSHGADMSDYAIAARERVRLALKAVGPDLAGMLIDVCCHLKGLEQAEKSGRWPQRAGKVVLQIALRQLARHYGFLSEAGTAHASRARPSHWGTPDYRPKISNDDDQGQADGGTASTAR